MPKIQDNQGLQGSGSPQNGEPEFVCVGKIHRSHGLDGSVVLNPMTDFPERIRPGKKLLAGDEKRELTIRAVRTKPPYLLVRFDEIQDAEAASELRNTFVYVSVASLPKLPEGEYYFHQLIGLTAVSEDGTPLGRLEDILETGANDVYVIRLHDGSEKLVADIPANIGKVDINAGTMIVRIPEEY